MARSGPESLELHAPEGAFERIDEWLRAHGFFEPGGEGLVADLFLGYGLSQTIRREKTPPPPEPCALPLAACTVRTQTETLRIRSSREREDGHLGADLVRTRISCCCRTGACGDRSWRRVPGQRRAAPLGCMSG